MMPHQIKPRTNWIQTPSEDGYYWKDNDGTGRRPKVCLVEIQEDESITYQYLDNDQWFRFKRANGEGRHVRWCLLTDEELRHYL